MRRIRLYLITNDGHEVTAAVLTDLEALLADWARIRGVSTGTCGLVHIGFSRPNDEVIRRTLTERFRGYVLASGAARWGFPEEFEFTDLPVALIEKSVECHALPLFLGLSHWGYARADVEHLIEKPVEPRDWLVDLRGDDPRLYRELERIGATSAALYDSRCELLPEGVRDAADEKRFEYLAGRFDLGDPISILRVAPNRLLDADISTLPLTVRVWNVLKGAGIHRPRELLRLGCSGLLEQKNFGRKSLIDLSEGLLLASKRGHASSDTHEPVDTSGRLRGEIEGMLAEWPKQRREVFVRRVGFGVAPQTLEEIGKSLGITRERVRQIEKGCIQEVIHQQVWDDHLEAKLLRQLKDRREPLYMDLLAAEDPWFSGFEGEEAALQGIIETVSRGRLHALEVEGRLVVTHASVENWRDLVEEVVDSLDHAIERRWTREEVDLWVGAQLRTVNAVELHGAVMRSISPRLHFAVVENGQREVLVSVGERIADHAARLLASTDTPLHFTEIADRVAKQIGTTSTSEFRRAVRNALARMDALLFGRGLYGTVEHIQLEKDLQQDIRDELEGIIQSGEEGRQWHSKELVDRLYGSRPDLPQVVDVYMVGILLKQSETVKGYGRMMWGARGDMCATSGRRIELAEVEAQMLKRQGRPMTTSELRAAVESYRGLGELFFPQPNSVMARVSPGCWGLVDRDFGLDVGQRRRLLNALEHVLRRRGTGLHVSELRASIETGSEEDFEHVTAYMMLSLSSTDSRFRASRGQILGLAEWPDARRVPMRAAIERAVSVLGLPVAEETLYEKVKEVLMRSPEREEFHASLSRFGLRFSVDIGMWVEEPADDAEGVN